MSKSNNLTDFLTDVADAIRTKKEAPGTINPQNFSNEIMNLQVSGADIKGKCPAYNSFTPDCWEDTQDAINSWNVNYIWTDGKDIFWSNGYTQKVLDKKNNTWVAKEWIYGSGVSEAYVDGANIIYVNNAFYCTNPYNTNIYRLVSGSNYWVSDGPSSWSTAQRYYPLKKINMWTDGYNVYYSSSNSIVWSDIQRQWNTATFYEIWSGEQQTFYFSGYQVWTDGTNIHHRSYRVLDRSTKMWNYDTSISPSTPTLMVKIGAILYGWNGDSDSNYYIFNKSSQTWTAKPCDNVSDMPFDIITPTTWTDGKNIFFYKWTGSASIKRKLKRKLLTYTSASAKPRLK